MLAAAAAGVGGIAADAALTSAPALAAKDSRARPAGASIPSSMQIESLAYYPSAEPLPVVRTIITQFQPGHGFVATGVSRSDVNDNAAGHFICGTQAATVRTVGDGTTYADLTSTRLRFDSTGSYLAVRYRLSSARGPRSLELDIANDAQFRHFYRWRFADRSSTLGAGFSYDDEWEQIFLSFADATATGHPSRSGLTAARLRVRDGGKPVTVQWQEISLVPEPAELFPRGVATICFDDLYQTQYLRGRPVLDAHGYRATVAVLRQAIGMAESMTLAELRSLQDDLGWEIGCHADTLAVHRATDIGKPLPEVEVDLRAEKTYLRENGLAGGNMFAYPSGLWNPAVIAMVRKYCQAGRLDFFRTQETFPPANPFKLRACGRISAAAGGHTAEMVRGYIDSAAAHRSWLILIFHKIVSGNAAISTECSLGDFESVISHLAGSGMAVLTAGDVLALAKAGRGAPSASAPVLSAPVLSAAALSADRGVGQPGYFLG